MAKDRPFKLVFKRGGDTPQEWTSRHERHADAAVEAGRLFRREKAKWPHVQIWYEVWKVDGRKPFLVTKRVLQTAAK